MRDGLLKLGRFLFAIAMLLFGVEYFIYAGSMKGPIPGPPWLPGLHWFAWLTGAALIAVAVCLASGIRSRLAATLLGVALLLNVLFLHLPGLIAQLHHPGPWTSSFELLALCGGAFVLASAMPMEDATDPSWSGALSWFATPARFAFALALVVFAVQHFIYARYVAWLVPAWIPGHLFWAYATAVAFVAAALAIAAKVQGKLAAALLGTMFLLWVIVLHVPRVAASPRNGDEATSLLIALAMSGASFILAGRFAADPSAS